MRHASQRAPVHASLVLLALAACRETQPVPLSSSAAPSSAMPTSSVASRPPASAAGGYGSPGAPPVGGRSWGFDSDPTEAPPKGFTFGRTGEGREGKWIVRAEPGAPGGPNVLAQVDADPTDFRFPVAVADDPAVRDVRLSVRCKMLSGKVDQACGLVLRYRDARNYYVTRANALEGNVRFYWVKDGKRQQLASAELTIERGTWHSYRIEAKGDRFLVFWNDKQVLEHRDSTFSEPGRVGLWTKADSVTLFDGLTAETL